MFALLILMALTIGMVGIGAAVVGAAHQSARESAADSASGAAAAGAEAALFRLNTTGATTSGTGSVGSNASYAYAVSMLTSPSDPCDGISFGWALDAEPARLGVEETDGGPAGADAGCPY